MQADLMCVKDEWLTPLEVTESSKIVLSNYPIIDICSSQYINTNYCKFEYYLSVESNSLDKINKFNLNRYNVFCNPPSLSLKVINNDYPHKELLYKLFNKYNIKSLAGLYFKLMVNDMNEGDLSSGIYIGVSSKLMGVIPEIFDYPVCICSDGNSESITKGGRMKFNEIIDEKIVKGKAPTQTNFIVCMSNDIEVKERFKEEFSKYGRIV